MSEPAGIVMPFAGTTAPQGYLLCDGSAVSRSTYSNLFTAIGTTYGAGDGSTTFNVPDLSGRVVIGVSGTHALGSTGGTETVTLIESELPAHVHEVPQHGHGNTIAVTTPELSHSIVQPEFQYTTPNTSSKRTSSVGYTYTTVRGTGNAAATRSTNVSVSDHTGSCTIGGTIGIKSAYDSGSSGNDVSHNNMQPFVVVNFIISVGG